jgi:hypothetical protein
VAAAVLLSAALNFRLPSAVRKHPGKRSAKLMASPLTVVSFSASAAAASSHSAIDWIVQ